MTDVETAMQFCPRCACERPRGACRPTRLGEETVLLCPVCGLVTREVARATSQPLLAVYAGALRYPFQPDAAIALGALAIASWVLSFVPFIGGLMAGGVVVGYLFSIVRVTAMGKDDLPQATDFEGISDIARPMVRVLIAAAVAFGPLILGFGYTHGTAALPLVVLLGGAWAVAYLPGAMAVASFQDGCLGAANPIPVVEMVRRVPGPYALTVGVLAGALVAAVGVRVALVAAIPSIPLVSTVVRIAVGAASLVIPVMMARVLGLMLRECREELGLDV